MKTVLIDAPGLPGGSIFHVLEPGEYFIGIDFDAVERIAPESADGVIKKTYVVNSSPRHRVRLAGGSISLFAVSLEDFERFVRETGYLTDAEREGWGWIAEKGLWIKRPGLSWRAPFGDDGDAVYHDHAGSIPVLQASWNDASAFCAWLSEKTGREIRLPDEAEWEIFAADRGCVSMTEAITSDDIIEYTGGREYAAALITRVGAERELPHGVLWEWCADWFAGYPGSTHNKEYGSVYRVLRGGSLQSHSLQRGREYRFRRCPTARSPYYGFRLFIALKPDKETG